MKDLYHCSLSFIKHSVYMLAVLSLLTACGGGSSDEGTNTGTNTDTNQNFGLATIIGNNQVTISWNPVANASSYNLYYATQSLSNLVPDNISMASGVKLENVSSPHVQTGLASTQPYFFVLTALINGVESVVSNESSATPTKPLPGNGNRLNDTGITRCANATSNNLDCSDATTDNFPNQDAENGRDAQATASPSTLVKVGAGSAGFDFSKLDANGDLLAASASAWSCVKDNHTGLIWEVKTDDDGLRDKDTSYTWFSTTNNGGGAGTEDADASSVDNTSAFVTAVNAGNGLCGATDWRLPTKEELRSIVDYSSASVNPTIDTDYFPNPSLERHWSSSPRASDSGEAWAVFFNTGFDEGRQKSNLHNVRLVRSGQ